jgi:hypothetical protein
VRWRNVRRALAHLPPYPRSSAEPRHLSAFAFCSCRVGAPFGQNCFARFMPFRRDDGWLISGLWLDAILPVQEADRSSLPARSSVQPGGASWSSPRIA